MLYAANISIFIQTSQDRHTAFKHGEHQQPYTDMGVCRLITFQASSFFQVCNINPRQANC